MNKSIINGADFLAMVRSGASALGASRTRINDLNVFPIPDGDTGDNMYMTIRFGCDAASSLTSDAPLGLVAATVSRGMLLGARGNSGVILSRIFAGIASGLGGSAEADMALWHAAMSNGVNESYNAVAVPVEGTMLTVFKDAVRAAGAVRSGLDDYFKVLCAEMKASVERTPTLLNVLRDAGVVDSGGAGLDCIAEGMAAAFAGEAFENLSDSPSASSKVDLCAFGEDSVLEYGYCTEFLLRLQTSKVGDVGAFDESVIREFLQSAGESLVFFREGSIIKTHVHTRTPGEILNRLQRWGEFLTVKIENMTLQHHENHMESKVFKAPRRKKAVVAVASGDGIVQLLRDNGADFVIEGGQTMNPSAASFVEAFDTVNADVIYVLPDNSNIILTAQQAAALYEGSDVRVIPTKSVAAGYVVLGSVDFSGNPDEVAEEAAAVAQDVVAGMVSVAIRDSGDAKEGEYIGFRGSSIVSHSASRLDAAASLCESLGAASSDVIIIFKGADVPSEEADNLLSALQSAYPRTETALVDGGQPVFDYMIIVQ